jgi:hypothetical protein
LDASRPLAIVVVPSNQPALDLLLLTGQLNPGILPRKVLQLPAVALIAQRVRTAHCDKQACGNDRDNGTHKGMLIWTTINPFRFGSKALDDCDGLERDEWHSPPPSCSPAAAIILTAS